MKRQENLLSSFARNLNLMPVLASIDLIISMSSALKLLRASSTEP